MAGLTKQVIVEAAFDLLDETGIDGLTVRALANRLDVKAPALYWHLKSKRELLDLMGTEIVRRVTVAVLDLPTDLSFIEQLRGYAYILRSEYRRHRDGARTFSGTRLTDPEPLRNQEIQLARMVDRGIGLERIADAVELVNAYVTGFVIEEQERAQSGPGRYPLADRDAWVGPDHPLAVQMGPLIFRPADERFDRQLTILLSALA